MKVKILWIACLLIFLGTQVSYGQRARPNNGRKAAIAKKKMGAQKGKNKSNSKMQKKMKDKASMKAKEKMNAQRKNRQENAAGEGTSQASAGQQRGSSQKPKIKILSSLQLSDDLLIELDSIQVNAFHVDDSGMLSPNPGYHMGFHEGQNKIFIKPVGIKFDKSILQHESKEIASGILLSCLDCETCNIDEYPNNEGETCAEFITLTPSSGIQQLE